MARRRWTEVAARVPRWEGARGAVMRKGGERRARCGEAETGGTFYRNGEAVVGRGDGWRSGGQMCAIKAPVTRRGDDGAATTHVEIEEELVRVGSAPYGCGRVSIGGGRSGDVSRGRRLGLRPEEEEDPSGPELG
jgi:hypothetical protein